jgi:membrane-bound lytic murein transglycosylase D
MPRNRMFKTFKYMIFSLWKNPVRRKQGMIILIALAIFLIIPRMVQHVPPPIQPTSQPISPQIAPQPSIFDPFPFPDALKPQVEFWKKIFTEYTSKQMVIHDEWYVQVIYEVFDLNSSKFATEDEAWEAVKTTQDNYVQLLDTLSKHWDTPETADERRVLNLFQGIPEQPRFKKQDAKDRVRAQLGQADRVKDGIIRAGRYLDVMKQIVAEYQLPEKIVYLPLIESVFNPSAQSHLGAAGMWQFMHGTGKQYQLAINPTVDERRDPLKSTRAAAQVLAHNYETVKSWPLAITAYNHGLQGIKNAVKQAGSEDIATIIQQYDGPRFGFSSRNFYPEFLAAVDVALQATEYFGELDLDDPVAVAQVTLPDYVSVKAIERYCSLPKPELKQLNPALASTVFDPGNFLPKGYQLNIPLAQKAAFETAYASIPAALKYQYLPVKARHKIEKGQTLATIAKRYNTTVKAIAKLNKITDPQNVRIGRILDIPGGYVSSAKQPEAVAQLPTASIQENLEHQVEKGQTLFTIARKYQTSPEVIARANRLDDPRQIRIGQRLNIPGEKRVAPSPGEKPVGPQQKQASPPDPHSLPSLNMEHQVEKGQTLVTIARKYNTSVEAITQLNAIKNPRKIKVGQRLKIPKG